MKPRTGFVKSSCCKALILSHEKRDSNGNFTKVFEYCDGCKKVLDRSGFQTGKTLQQMVDKDAL